MKKKNKRDGFIILARVDALYRILYSRKHTPEEHIEGRNRSGAYQHEIIHLIKSEDVINDHARMLILFNHRQFVDATHVDRWFDLSAEDVQYFKSLGGGL